MSERASWMDDNRTRTYDDGGVSADWEERGREQFDREAEPDVIFDAQGNAVTPAPMGEDFDALNWLRAKDLISEDAYWKARVAEGNDDDNQESS